MSGKRSRRYPAELKERATRMVLEHQHEYPSQWKAIQSIGEQLGVHHESLRIWVRRVETDAQHPTSQGSRVPHTSHYSRCDVALIV
jgi:transposase